MTEPPGFSPLRRNNAQAGVTLAELAVALLVFSILAGMGLSTGAHFIATRTFNRTQAALEQVKACLVARARGSERYPTYSPGLDCETTLDLSQDVDFCLCRAQTADSQNARDAWNGRLRFLEGARSGGQGLAGEFFAASAPRGQTRVPPDASSYATDPRGVRREGIAFALLSLGPDGTPDKSGYALFASAVVAGRMPTPLNAAQLRDDHILLVAADELAASLAP